MLLGQKYEQGWELHVGFERETQYPASLILALVCAHSLNKHVYVNGSVCWHVSARILRCIETIWIIQNYYHMTYIITFFTDTNILSGQFLLNTL